MNISKKFALKFAFLNVALSVSLYCMEQSPTNILAHRDIISDNQHVKNIVELCQTPGFVQEYLTNRDSVELANALTEEAKKECNQHIDLSFLNSYMKEPEIVTPSLDILTGYTLSNNDQNVILQYAYQKRIIVYNRITKQHYDFPGDNTYGLCKKIIWSSNDKYIAGLFLYHNKQVIRVINTEKECLVNTMFCATQRILDFRFSITRNALRIITHKGLITTWDFLEKQKIEHQVALLTDCTDAYFDRDNEEYLFVMVEYNFTCQRFFQWMLMNYKVGEEVVVGFFQPGVQTITFDREFSAIIISEVTKEKNRVIVQNYQFGIGKEYFLKDAIECPIGLHSDQETIIVKQKDGTMALFDLESQEFSKELSCFENSEYCEIVSHPYDVLVAAITRRPDSVKKDLFLSNKKRTIKLLLAEQKEIRALSFSNNGLWVSAIIDNALVFYPINTCRKDYYTFEQKMLLHTLHPHFKANIALTDPALKESFAKLDPKVQQAIISLGRISLQKTIKL